MESQDTTEQATVVELTSPGGAKATFYPAVGFNLIDWRVPGNEGKEVALIYAEADIGAGGSGTRSGNPILFPFPNRIAEGRYRIDGVDYALPLPADHPHAIHGFCAKAAWTDYEQVGDASVTAAFRLRRDAPAGDWPGDLELRVTFDLDDVSLTATSLVSNLGSVPTPFGLGFHPYFTTFGAETADDLRLWCPAAGYWPLANSIPTGDVHPVTESNDFRGGPVIGSRHLDDVLTELPGFEPESDGLMTRASISGPRAEVDVRGDQQFREIVVFTQTNRMGLAVEPYTCPTDAVNLTARGQDVGWQVLAPKERRTLRVQYRVGLPGKQLRAASRWG